MWGLDFRKGSTKLVRKWRFTKVPRKQKILSLLQNGTLKKHQEKEKKQIIQGRLYKSANDSTEKHHC